jgi:hypothetical protein
MGGYGTQYGIRQYGIEDDLETIGVSTVSPVVFGDNGGEPLTLHGAWTSEEDMEIHFGPLGSLSDPRCYFGQGYGLVRPAPESGNVTCWTPPAPAGQAKITVKVGPDSTVLSAVVSVVERSSRVKVASLFSSHPPWTGRRGVPR